MVNEIQAITYGNGPNSDLWNGQFWEFNLMLNARWAVCFYTETF